jgi:hypothetical protein
LVDESQGLGFDKPEPGGDHQLVADVAEPDILDQRADCGSHLGR